MINVVDRVPTEVLQNGAIRWEQFDSSGNSLGYVYLKKADNPSVVGTPLGKVLFDEIDKYLCPSGLICMWSGSANNIPTGWYLCNGQNGTPDLRDKFIVGSGNEYSIGSTGGEKKHTLTINEMPSHNHDFYAYDTTAGVSVTYLEATRDNDPVKIVTKPGRRISSSAMIASTGGGEAFDNRPPYYALAFIMKG